VTTAHAFAPTYHLWLKPSGETLEVLSRAVRDLASTFGAPVFEPHVTLLTNLVGTEQEHVRRGGELARRLRPVPIVLVEPSTGPHYFQCVFLKVDPTPPVMSANMVAREIFSAPDEPYFPHLSLLYGLFPEARKVAVVDGLSPTLLQTFEAQAVHLVRAHSTDPADWLEIGEFELAV